MTGKAWVAFAAPILIIIIVAGCGADRSGPPATDVRPVTDTYHGVAIEDNYQWLENPADSQVQRWTEAQSRYAQEVLDNIPSRQATVP